MIRAEKCIVMDIDGTLCPIKNKNQTYEELKPNSAVVNKLKEFKRLGFYIILYTARNMRTYDGNHGLINANTAKLLLPWLDQNEIPYDEIYFGKPWPGRGGFIVDDKAIRPDEFLKLEYTAIMDLVGTES